MKKTEISYNDAMTEVERILGELDGRQVDVDLLASRLKRATELIDICRTKLRKAQEEVDKIIAQD